VAFEHTRTVRFHEIDRAGIVYFADVLQYCHVVYEELMTQIVGSLEVFFSDSGWGMPLVHTEADYSRPNRLGDALRIALTVERLGKTSVTFAYEIWCQEELRARAKLVHAFVDMKTFKPIEAPQAFRQGLSSLGLLPKKQLDNDD
jgi:1,4-dihydroxy-2-naphthoyl-CoA hydrolase